MQPQGHDDWDELTDSALRLLTSVKQARSIRINSTAFRTQAKQLVQTFFRAARPGLTNLGIQENDLNAIDQSFQNLNSLAQSRNRRSSYLRELKRIKNQIADLGIQRDRHIGKAAVPGPTQGLSSLQIQILTTLEQIIPSAALSFRQALDDLSNPGRKSYRGPAAELREVMREVVDHLAPDTAVMRSPDFQLEKNREKPTLRQKVQFILKNRGQGATARDSSKDTLARIDAGADILARSIYNRGSLSAHVVTSRQEVINLLRYTEALLAELLQIAM